MTHERWFCPACTREWVWAHAWDESQGCPTCHAAPVERVTYSSRMRGFDIPRGRNGLPASPDNPAVNEPEFVKVIEPIVAQPHPAVFISSETPLTLHTQAAPVAYDGGYL